jgi:peptidoglycan-N-acetylglucosamine deacetylase
MAVTSPPRPPGASTASRRAGVASQPPHHSGQLRVHWDRVAVFAVILVLIIVLIVVMITRAFVETDRSAEVSWTADSATHPTAAESATQPAAATSAPSAAQLLCPTAASQPITAAPAVAGGDPAAHTVALTFDDGPGDFTPQVLDVLREKQVRATFFVLGREVAQKPGMLQAIVGAGHMVGNHSWSHDMPKPSSGWKASTLTREIDRTREAIAEATGQQACLFRPPGGVIKGVPRVSRDASLSIVMWSVDTRDWAGQRPGDVTFADTLRKRALRGLKEEHPLVLMHDGGGYRGSTVAALPRIIDDYRAAGYQFVDLAGRV